jgi:hypothetical protein
VDPPTLAVSRRSEASRSGWKPWGSNGQGNLGDGSTAQNFSDVPVAVKGVGGVASLWGSPDDGAGRGLVSCAVLRVGGTVKCWGGDGFGMVANGGAADVYDTPVAATGLTGAKSVSIDISGQGACTLLTDGGVSCWGDGYSGGIPQKIVGIGP